MKKMQIFYKEKKIDCHFQVYLKLQLEQILYNLFMQIFQKILDKHMVLHQKLVWDTQQNLGELVEQWLEFLELVVVVLIEVVKVLLVT